MRGREDSQLPSCACTHDSRLAGVGCEEMWVKLTQRKLSVMKGDQREANSQITRTIRLKEIRKMEWLKAISWDLRSE